MSAGALRILAPVLANDAEGEAARRLVLEVPPAWPASRPGQFVMLHLGAAAGAGAAGEAGVPVRHDPLLPRPMAIYRSGPREGGRAALDVLYKVVGRGTALLAALRPGDRLGVVGPLGRSFPLPGPGERSLLVGGGTGIASLHELARACRERGPTAVLLGARRAGELMGVADFDALDVELRVATDDGSRGERGLVTALLEAALEEGPARIYACGPTPMMRRAAAIADAAGAPCWVSLENRMACGFGVCLGCAVPRAGEGRGFHLVCRDGPVFASETLAMGGLP